MTRITDFGRKRTYVQAGFSNDVQDTAAQEQDHSLQFDLEGSKLPTNDTTNGLEAPGEPPKKKRRRSAKPKKKEEGVVQGDGQKELKDDTKDEESVSAVDGKEGKRQEKKQKASKKAGKDKKDKRISASEKRRLKRIDEKKAQTTCFACREKGHTAKECPSTAKEGGTNRDRGKDGGEKVVGICYRCGSTRHNLSRCKKPIDEFNPLPFASCFVCQKKGHLASSCPKNTDKGVYPNGGSCKLCGETSHLAKDCNLRKQDSTKKSAILGTGKEAGADEDDFHTLNRKRSELDRDEKREEKKKHALNVKIGVQSGIVKAFGKQPKPPAKKVVYF